jgi:hypothetical protein
MSLPTSASRSTGCIAVCFFATLFPPSTALVLAVARCFKCCLHQGCYFLIEVHQWRGGRVQALLLVFELIVGLGLVLCLALCEYQRQ